MLFAGLGEVIAERVVPAIPFTTVREVDLSRSGLSRKRRRCIERLGMGTRSAHPLPRLSRPDEVDGPLGRRAHGDRDGGPLVFTEEVPQGYLEGGAVSTGRRAAAEILRSAGR